jgi:hypothetical protein
MKRSAALILGYVGAVASASAASIALVSTWVVLYGAIEQPAPYLGLAWNIRVVLRSFPLAVLLCTPMTGIAALVPFMIVRGLAEGFSIRSRWYFIGSGALTGLLLSPFAVYLVENGENLTSPPHLALAAGTIVPGGAIGGFVCWLIERRHLVSETRQIPATV